MSSTQEILTEPVRFTDGKRTFVYIYKRVSVDMAEHAIAIQEYQSIALQKPAGSITDIIRSGSANWSTICCAYLLREEINEEIQPFSGDYGEAYSILRNLEGEEAQEEIRKVLHDFFTKRGRREQISRLLRGEQSLDVLNVLSVMMTAAAKGQPEQGLLQSVS